MPKTTTHTDNKESAEQQCCSLLHQLKEDGRSEWERYPHLGMERRGRRVKEQDGQLDMFVVTLGLDNSEEERTKSQSDRGKEK